MKFTSTHFFILLIIVIIGGLIFIRANSEPKTAASPIYDEFAQCIADAGMVFYGAFWCPHCQEQKAMFENSSKIPYVECSTPDRQGQLQVCIDEGITGYPTWKTADGEVLDGTQQLSVLSAKTGCVLPQS